MKSFSFLISISLMLFFSHTAYPSVYRLEKYGLKAGSTLNAVPILAQAVQQITDSHKGDGPVVLKFEKGTYHFYPVPEMEKEVYISNHDQDNPKSLGILLEGKKGVILDGQDARFIFHGRMLPLAIAGCEGCTFKDFSIDFDNPQITQLTVLENDAAKGEMTFQVAPWVKYRIEDGRFIAEGDGWAHTPQSCIAFDARTRHILYNTADMGVHFSDVKEKADHVIVASGWKEPRLPAGTVIAARTWQRPAPGILLSHSRDIRFENVRVHYAEGMGLLAQMSENIFLERFGVCLKGEDDSRYFTTQADATHFSGCRGKIVSTDGLYENMMDDAINVHGTYLKIRERLDERTVVASYMHPQCWGFDWGFKGDSVQFVRSSTMEALDGCNRIASIRPADKETVHGARSFRITFEASIPVCITEGTGFGIENLSWTPEVVFARNTIRNNRARGSLFSTPGKTEILDNLFDHTSGTAILLCGDCNGWYETGACREVIIKGNRFVNALTSMFQFTNAVISIYPEIPDLEGQKKYFHGLPDKAGIVIEDNTFDTFDNPLLYAKSVQGLVFRNNRIRHNTEYPAFHPNRHPFFFEKVADITIEDNRCDTPFDPARDIRFRLTSPKEIKAFKSEN